jgi:hypothetical protein
VLARIVVVLMTVALGCNGGGYKVPVEPPSAVPTATAISPDSGTEDGGTGVLITGTGFEHGARVVFDQTVATIVIVRSSNEILAFSPPHEQGAVDVTVVNPNGDSSTMTGRYTYTPSDSIDPCNGCWDY